VLNFEHPAVAIDAASSILIGSRPQRSPGSCPLPGNPRAPQMSGRQLREHRPIRALYRRGRCRADVAAGSPFTLAALFPSGRSIYGPFASGEPCARVTFSISSATNVRRRRVCDGSSRAELYQDQPYTRCLQRSDRIGQNPTLSLVAYARPSRPSGPI
jgi:hypothetical protein